MQDGGWNPCILLGDRDVDGRMILKWISGFGKDVNLLELAVDRFGITPATDGSSSSKLKDFLNG